ncbi:PadR family transcriptional regulator [Microbacterium sp. MPKO10]|uniref:PadR family transcriptional regulator n=1 Tax=Microbacterium sp. MPKO10 TaxID=2989818 RepID=UPI002236156C|nr:PadR family transcriptional regulator [Microbacterium sp. MPKO10]MCW4459631.1 PadR family transcriptional regulator [Microbacterium sp. MPKO10]
MTVKHSLLAILSLGDAYGLQLRDELVERAPHRASINVGQVYGTLDRLQRAALITSSHTTSDGLQLYTLTELGRSAASEWMRIPAVRTPFDWLELLDQILVTASIPGGTLVELLSGYRTALKPDLLEDAATAQTRPQKRAATAAAHVQLRAALGWLDQVEDSLSDSDAAFELSQLRPRRGRRALATYGA